MGQATRFSRAALLLPLLSCASERAAERPTGDPVAERLARLDAAVPGWRRAQAIEEIARLGPAAAPAATATLLQILERGAWDDRPAAAAALGWLHAEAAVPALIRALGAPDWRLAFAACRGLERLGVRAAAARAPLDGVASNHWMPPVRAAAAAALLAVDGTPDPPSELGDDFRFHHPFKRVCRRTISGAGWQRRPDGDERMERSVPGGKLYGINRGEFGGEVGFVGTWWRRQVLIADANPVGFAMLGPSLVVIEGLEHLSISEGKIWQLREADGRWQSEPMAQLPGAPITFRPTANAGLEIDTADGLVVVSPAGEIQSVSCPE